MKLGQRGQVSYWLNEVSGDIVAKDARSQVPIAIATVVGKLAVPIPGQAILFDTLDDVQQLRRCVDGAPEVFYGWRE